MRVSVVRNDTPRTFGNHVLIKRSQDQTAFPIIHIIGNAVWLDVPVADRTFKVFMLGILDREKSHLGPSGTDCAGSTPSTDACRAGSQRSAPDYQSAVTAPAGAGPSLSSTRARTTAYLEASSHPTVGCSCAIFEHALWAFARSLILDASVVATSPQRKNKPN